MPVLKNLEKLLKNAKVKYEIVKHKTVYTAFDKAKTLTVNPREIVKTVVLKLNTGKAARYAIASVPANKNFDKEKFKKVFNGWLKKTAKENNEKFKAAKSVDFAQESMIKKNIIKAKKGGTVPPYGSLFNLPAFIDNSLLKSKEIIINAGGFDESIKIQGSQAEKAEKIIKGSFSKTRK